MEILKKIKLVYQNFGIEGVLYACLRRFGIKIKKKSFIDTKKESLKRRIINLSQKKIMDGIYKSTFLNCDLDIVKNDISSKLLGSYEKQIQSKIIEIKKKYNLEKIINFGAADGFHLIGLIKNNYFNEGFAFEVSEKSKKELKINIALNDLNEKIYVYGKASFEDLNVKFKDTDFNKSLYLVDIEGEEFNLFTEKNLKFFINSYGIIENHEFLFKDKKKVDNFYKLISDNFEVEIIENTSRNPFKFKQLDDLHDDERWLLMSEGRKKNMNWIYFRPKNN